MSWEYSDAARELALEEKAERLAEDRLEDFDGAKADHLADVWEQELDRQWDR